ncbi:hypothetical protein, partial [Methyloceanibacter sp.]|uniref:hypothetical protein n=1 Tax=Methyloceanibacter sp. TaxID=1965321 RepID=UPI00351B8D74
MGKLSDLAIATIGAQSLRWPAHDTSLQWQALHDLVATAQQAARNADNEISSIEADPNLSVEGKRRRAAEIAKKSIEALENNKELAKAEDAVADGCRSLMIKSSCSQT